MQEWYAAGLAAGTMGNIALLRTIACSVPAAHARVIRRCLHNCVQTGKIAKDVADNIRSQRE